MEPLASKLRPKSLEEVYGQDHLIGKNGILSKMLEKKQFLSFILHGNPGTGKTTIANLFAEASNLDFYNFNASTDNKAKLKDILDLTSYHNVLIIIDEIHRMKTDIQDYLLPFVESGKAIMIGITTLNPYFSINQAIRSRTHLYEVKPLGDLDIKKAILNGLNKLDADFNLTNDAIETIIRFSNYEIRSALNILEAISIVVEDDTNVTSNLVRSIIGKPQLSLDDSEDNYYEALSALQKSIRGSDVNAAIHYLGRLVTLGDLDIITRRLLVIAYEDIGLANPNLPQKVLSACNTAKMIGFPEARIPLSVVVIELALSPKSNSAYTALDLAIEDYKNGKGGVIPKFLNNNYLKSNPEAYLYPHDYKNALTNQKYLPDDLITKKYYKPKLENPYEKALAEKLKLIEKIKEY